MVGLGTTVNQTQLYVALRVYLNPSGGTQQLLLNYMSPNTALASAAGQLVVTVAPSTTNASFNLATLFAALNAPVMVIVTDITNPGVGFLLTTATGVGKVGVGAGLSWMYQADGTTTLPTIFIDNANGTTTLVLQLTVVSL